jgi:hypothetical protein
MERQRFREAEKRRSREEGKQTSKKLSQNGKTTIPYVRIALLNSGSWAAVSNLQNVPFPRFVHLCSSGTSVGESNIKDTVINKGPDSFTPYQEAEVASKTCTSIVSIVENLDHAKPGNSS